MTNSNSIAFHQLPVPFPIPGMIKVIAIIQRIEILVRRRKNRQTSSLSLTDYSPVFYRKCLSLLLRGSDMTLQIILRIRPKYFFRSEEHTSELQSLLRISYAVFCLQKKIHKTPTNTNSQNTSQ